MDIDIYNSTKKSTKYLAVPSGTDLRSWKAPNGFDPDLMSVSPVSESKNVQRGQNRIGMDSNDVLDQIDKNGYAVFAVSVTITIGTN